jgi:hypothetical protein
MRKERKRERETEGEGGREERSKEGRKGERKSSSDRTLLSVLYNTLINFKVRL